MFKKVISVTLVLLLACTLLTACDKCDDSADIPSFADVNWSRSIEADIEYISFGAEGDFAYFCACGNPVNDSDLCEGYTYDEKSKTITLDCIEKTDDMTTEIIVISHSEDELVLDFDGDIRTFLTGDAAEMDNSTLEYNGEKYVAVEYPDDIFNYTTEASEVAPVTMGEYSAVVGIDGLFAKEAEVASVNALIADDANYNWKIDVHNADTDTARVISDYIPSADIYAMKDAVMTETVDSDDIKSYAMLTKTYGPVSASIELIWINDTWYWRSNEFDKEKEGWPELILKVDDSLASFIGNP